MRKFYSALLLCICVLFSQTTNAQLVVAANGNANALAQTLAGNGVTLSNITINCPGGAAGTFSNGLNTNLGMATGIVLTAGSIDSLPGPNDLSNTTADNQTIAQ